jgi:two-component sensor histidine kinase
MRIIITLLLVSFIFSSSLAQNDTIFRQLEKLKGIEKVKYLNTVADSYLHISPKQAKAFAQQALEIAQHEKTDTLIVISSSQIASVYFQEGDYDKAMSMYLEILKLSKKIDYYKGMSNSYNNIGNIYYMKEENQQAFNYYSLSLELEKKMGYDLGIGESYENIAIVLDNQKKYKESLEYYAKALEYYKKANKNDYLPQLYNNIGVSYRSQNNLQKALEYFYLALEQNQKLGQIESLAYNWQNIGAIYLKQGKINVALESFEKSNVIGKEFKDIVKGNYEYLAEAYSKKEDFQNAYNFQKKFTQLKDSLFSKESEQRIAELEGKYQNEKKQQEIESLQKNSEIQSLEISKKNIIIYATTVISILALGLTFLFYNRYQLKHKSNVLLMKANEQIQQSVKEKEVLLQEVHHRVKNNLQLVSSLLAWQSEFVQDNQFQQLIEENIARIKSMALVHENLYISPNLSEVAVKEYLHNIITYLQQSFDTKNDITIEYQIAPVLLNAQQIIPIGLIVNELISNAYKYAFSGISQGQISVTFEEQFNHYYLKISDTGNGLPNDYKEKLKKSLGLQLVQMLVRQLRGQLQIQTQNPTMFEITF